MKDIPLAFPVIANYLISLCQGNIFHGNTGRKQWNKHDLFPWGKHQGEPLMSVIIHDVSYITWCIENVKGFVLDNETYELYETFAETPYLNR